MPIPLAKPGKTELRNDSENQVPLEKNEALYRSIVENAHGGICIIDDMYRIIYGNKELSRITGYSHDDYIHQHIQQFLSEESKSIIEKFYLQRLRGEKFPRRY